MHAKVTIDPDLVDAVCVRKLDNGTYQYFARMKDGTPVMVRRSATRLYSYAHIYRGHANSGKPAGLPTQTAFSMTASPRYDMPCRVMPISLSA